MIIRLVKLTFAHEHCAAFIELFNASQPKINAMQGCNGVVLLRDTLQPTVFFTKSSWDTNEALEAYRNSELFISVWARTKVLFSAKPEAWSTIQL